MIKKMKEILLEMQSHVAELEASFYEKNESEFFETLKEIAEYSSFEVSGREHEKTTLTEE